MKTALVVVDIQNDYFPGGRMELEGSIDAARKARHLLDHFRRNRSPLVHIRHVSTRPGAAFFLPGTRGVEFNDLVRPLEHETVFEKHFPNSFRDTPLLAYLRDENVRRVVICGMMTHMCIDATTRAAFDHGFECLLARDACATRTLVHQGQSVPAGYVHLSFLAALDAVYAKVSDAEEIIARL
jgi:nicotinamidase-related amidase